MNNIALLKQINMKYNWSEIGRAVGVHASTVWAWKEGRLKVPDKYMEDLERLLVVPKSFDSLKRGPDPGIVDTNLAKSFKTRDIINKLGVSRQAISLWRNGRGMTDENYKGLMEMKNDFILNK